MADGNTMRGTGEVLKPGEDPKHPDNKGKIAPPDFTVRVTNKRTGGVSHAPGERFEYYDRHPDYSAEKVALPKKKGASKTSKGDS